MTNVTSEWRDGDLHFLDKDGDTIFYIDGTNRKLVVPSGSSLEGDGATVAVLAPDDSTLEADTDLHVKDGGITAVKLADALSGISDGLGMLRVARATFNPTANAGERTAAAHGLGVTIPDKAIVCGGFCQVNTTFTSATDAATIAIHVESANDIVSAIAISNGGNPWDAGKKAILPKANTPESTSVSLTEAREVTATVASEALTGGKLTLFLFYVMGA